MKPEPERPMSEGRRRSNRVFERAFWLRRLPNPPERESVLLGSMLADGSPLLVPLKILGESASLSGPRGCGKTASLSLVIEQFEASSVPRHTQEDLP